MPQAVGRFMAYLNIALECDTPILEAIWWSLPVRLRTHMLRRQLHVDLTRRELISERQPYRRPLWQTTTPALQIFSHAIFKSSRKFTFEVRSNKLSGGGPVYKFNSQAVGENWRGCGPLAQLRWLAQLEESATLHKLYQGLRVDFHEARLALRMDGNQIQNWSKRVGSITTWVSVSLSPRRLRISCYRFSAKDYPFEPKTYFSIENVKCALDNEIEWIGFAETKALTDPMPKQLGIDEWKQSVREWLRNGARKQPMRAVKKHRDASPVRRRTPNNN